MNEPETRLCDAEAMAALLSTMADALSRGRLAGRPLRLVGIRTRGYPLACRLAEELRRNTGETVPVGALDITLYRDDLDNSAHWPVLLGTDITFPVDGADVILVDDVLYTGRTIRAALNSVCDFGRPARVRLAVLIDRGHRELPIQPDVVGMSLDVGHDERVRVHVRPLDPVDEVLRVRRT